MNSWFGKGFDGINDYLFDDVIKYLDFPLEDVDGGGGEAVVKDFHLPIDDVEQNYCGGGEEWDYNFQNLEPPRANVLAGMSNGFCGDCFGDCLAKSHSVSVNHWSSTSKASSRRSVIPDSESADAKGSTGFQASSPLSVLESSSTSSAAKPAFINPKPGFLVKRGRSKRRRVSSFNLHFTLPLTSSTSSTSGGSNASVGSESESYLIEEPAKKRLEKKKKLTWRSGFNDMKKSPSKQPTLRKCLHCPAVSFPEYRPAASPTFVPALHSNSHKKVVEMRKKTNGCLSVPPESISM
ncbi:Detected protein of unknown function [Hibiscus syriacus]|uniref:Uncharacterized protein n=1 Tax=Hibiscus syriacus TaxID=106335 RepID=A0A6A2XL31_HIBSY|nr:Detected protein of unknown function [Hibiscus syriacus]